MNMHRTKGRNVAHRWLIGPTSPASNGFASTPRVLTRALE